MSIDTENTQDNFPAGPPSVPRDRTFLDDPVVDHLLRAVVTLTQELSVTRDRLRTIEAVLSENGQPLAERIEAYVPNADEDAARLEQREKLIKAVLDPLVEKLSRKD